MSLTAKIDQDVKEAMLARAADKVGVLRMLKAAVKNAAIEKGGADAVLADADVIAVVRKEVKKRQDSIASYEGAGRADLADKEKAELPILQAYLPAELSADELEKIVRDAIAETGATSKKEMGTVMKAAQAKAAGRADGKTLSQLVQKLLP